MNLWIIFLTGLTIGGLNCLALQMGLLATTITSKQNTKKDNVKFTFWPTFSFLGSKLLAYTIIGAVLGALGEELIIRESVGKYIEIAASVYVIIVAANLLKIHPFLRYLEIQPPHFLSRIVRNQSKSKEVFAPATLGALTVFIPCGVTIAMETLAISTGSAIKGALIVGIFIFGNVVLFSLFAIFSNFVGKLLKANVMKIAALFMLFLGIFATYESLAELNNWPLPY